MEDPPRVRVLGVDYGEKRLGLAVSDPGGLIALALDTVQVENRRQALAAVVAACRETEAEQVVVGLPLNMDGTRGPMADKADAFADALGRAAGLPVATWDERLSTAAAERVLLEADLSRRKRKKVRDRVAAQVILQGYLDALQA